MVGKIITYITHHVDSHSICAICLEPVAQDAVKLSCHAPISCAECMGHWLESQIDAQEIAKCPFCRTFVDSSNLKATSMVKERYGWEEDLEEESDYGEGSEDEAIDGYSDSDGAASINGEAFMNDGWEEQSEGEDMEFDTDEEGTEDEEEIGDNTELTIAEGSTKEDIMKVDSVSASVFEVSLDDAAKETDNEVSPAAQDDSSSPAFLQGFGLSYIESQRFKPLPPQPILSPTELRKQNILGASLPEHEIQELLAHHAGNIPFNFGPDNTFFIPNFSYDTSILVAAKHQAGAPMHSVEYYFWVNENTTIGEMVAMWLRASNGVSAGMQYMDEWHEKGKWVFEDNVMEETKTVKECGMGNGSIFEIKRAENRSW